MKNNYFVFGSCYDYCEYMVYDALSEKNVFFYNSTNLIRNKFLYYLSKIHMRLNLPFKSIWFKRYFDYKSAKRNQPRNYFIFFDSNPLTCDTRFLTFIKKKIKKSITCIYFCNSLSMRNLNDPNYFKLYFDRIFTYDLKDAKEHNFEYYPSLYSYIYIYIYISSLSRPTYSM